MADETLSLTVVSLLKNEIEAGVTVPLFVSEREETLLVKVVREHDLVRPRHGGQLAQDREGALCDLVPAIFGFLDLSVHARREAEELADIVRVGAAVIEAVVGEDGCESPAFLDGSDFLEVPVVVGGVRDIRNG